MKQRAPRRSGNDGGGGGGGIHGWFGDGGDGGGGRNDASGAVDAGTLSWKDSAMNLTNCVVGAGALSLPSFFKSCGVVTGTILLVASCLWTWVGDAY